MKKTLIIAAFFAAALAVSCNKSITEPTSVKGGEIVSFSCVIAPNTKVAIDDQGKTKWEAGDEILVHGESSSDRVVITLSDSDISSDGKVATISFAVDQEGVEGIKPYNRYDDKGYTSTFYAQYPASAAPSGSLYYYARFNDTNKPLMAAYNEGNKFVFYNLCGVISFKVKGAFDTYEFKGNNGEIVGYEQFQSRLAATDSDPVLQWSYSGDNGISGAKTKISSDVEADGSTVHYVCIPTGVNFTAGFTFSFFDGDELVSIASTSTPVNLERNKFLDLGDISSKLEEYVPPTSSDHKSGITGATNLSSNGPANCYIVTAPGAYKLPVLKGNSGEDAGNVFGVRLIWESYNNSDEVTANSVIEEIDFDGPENYVYFKTPSTLKNGNAVIAALDAQDNVIWSWHIWIPATAISSNTYGLGTKELMDRYLGAMDSDLDGGIGLGYQWGRKDPFPGPVSMSSGVPMAYSGTISVVHNDAPEGESKGAPPANVLKSIANPGIIYNANNNDWNSVNDDNLWSAEKTIYDPCPAGYKVPTTSEAEGMFAKDLSAAAGWESASDKTWFKVGSPATLFPVCGYLDDYSSSFKYSKVAERVAIWAAEGSSSSATIINMRLDGSARGVGSTSKSRVGFVRCIAE